MKVELIYNRTKRINSLPSGELLPSDFLIRYKNKYYLINGTKSTSLEVDKIYSLIDKTNRLWYKGNQKAYNTYLKHRNDNYITAFEFLKIIEREVKNDKTSRNQ